MRTSIRMTMSSTYYATCRMSPCLGAATAESVTFAADGAPWIWDRLPGIVARVGIPPDRVHEVLDFCHAAHHISLALTAFGVPETEHRPLDLELRRQLGHFATAFVGRQVASGWNSVIRHESAPTLGGIANADARCVHPWVMYAVRRHHCALI